MRAKIAFGQVDPIKIVPYKTICYGPTGPHHEGTDE
jgi:hypothetical protein